MELTPVLSKELKETELEMLRHFVRICEELKLQYFVLGGTLLGAVRHKGFIPWDDDIDVGMPRKDYEIFLQKGQAMLDSQFFLQTFRTDPEFPANFAKIRNSNTTFIETSIRNCKVNHGVYIDVFPLDYYPDGKVRAWIVEAKKLIYTGRIASVFYTEEKDNLKRKLFRFVSKVFVPSVERALVCREKLYKKETMSSKIVSYCGAYGKKEVVPACWFSDYCILEFEGMEVKAPVAYHEWLTHIYGDYLQLPPVEKRVGHHYVDVVDLKSSYTKYRDRKSN